MSPDDRTITIHLLDWRGISIEIRYEPEWLGGDLTAHLEIRSVEPPKALLPITETGYRTSLTGTMSKRLAVPSRS